MKMGYWCANLPYFLIIAGVGLPSGFANNPRHFMTESCGTVVGPDFGALIMYDRDVRKPGDHKMDIPIGLKNSILKCDIIIKGVPSFTETRYISAFLRDMYVHDPRLPKVTKYSAAECGRAYMTIYQGLNKAESKENFTMCGVDIIRTTYEWQGDGMIIEMYADYTNPAWPDLVAKNNGSTDNVTDEFPYPEIYIRVDVTSFDFACNDSVMWQYMKCNESKRCLDDSLRCDRWYSRNCETDAFPRDNSDLSFAPPGNCYAITQPRITTTPPPPPVPPPDLTPIWIILGILAGLLMLLWCCWRPGYLIWRCARLRNCPCCEDCGACWLSCFPCCVSCCYGGTMAAAGGGGGNACCNGGKSTSSWQRSELLTHENGGFSPDVVDAPSPISKWKKNVVGPMKDPVLVTGNAPVSSVSDPETDSTALSSGWLSLAGDGVHLREHR